MPSVLILGARAPAALELARRFHRAGWRAFVADSIPHRLCAWSQSVAGSISLPSPRDAPAAFATALARAISAHGIELVLPTCEEVFYLSRYRDRLPAGVRVLAEDFGKLRSLHSKWEFLQLAQGCGVEVPESQRVHSLAQAREWAAGAPLVLKPEFSRFGVHVRLYPEGIPAQAPELASLGTWVAQRFQPGTEFCSYAVADRGRLLALAAYQPRHRLRGSSSYYFEPWRSPQLEQFVRAFAAKTQFTGQLSFDWILSKEGKLSVLECNPRATSGVHLFAPDDAVPAALAGESEILVQPGHEVPAMLGPIMLGPGLRDAVVQGRVGEWRRDYQRATDVLAVRGERRVLPGGLLDLASYARLAIARGCNLREAATRDIEWDGEVLPAA